MNFSFYRMMRAVRGVLPAVVHNPDCQWFVALYAVTALLTWVFGWTGYGIVLVLAVALRHRIHAFSQRDRSILHSIEAWYFDADVRDLVKPTGADDAGDRA